MISAKLGASLVVPDPRSAVFRIGSNQKLPAGMKAATGAGTKFRNALEDVAKAPDDAEPHRAINRSVPAEGETPAPRKSDLPMDDRAGNALPAIGAAVPEAAPVRRSGQQIAEQASSQLPSRTAKTDTAIPPISTHRALPAHSQTVPSRSHPPPQTNTSNRLDLAPSLTTVPHAALHQKPPEGPGGGASADRVLGQELELLRTDIPSLKARLSPNSGRAGPDAATLAVAGDKASESRTTTIALTLPDDDALASKSGGDEPAGANQRDPGVRKPVADVTILRNESLSVPARPSLPLQQFADRILAEARGLSAELVGKPFIQATPPAPQRVLSLQLQPAELGSITVKLQLRGNTLEVRVSAERPQAAQLLRQDADALSGAIRAAGYVVERLVVADADRPAGWVQTAGAGDDEADQEQAGTQGRGPDADDPDLRAGPGDRGLRGQSDEAWRRNTWRRRETDHGQNPNHTDPETAPRRLGGDFYV